MKSDEVIKIKIRNLNVQKNTKKPQKEKSARETIGNDFDEEVVDKFPEVLPWNLPAPDSEKNGEKDSEKYRAVLVNADDEKVKETEEKREKTKDCDCQSYVLRGMPICASGFGRKIHGSYGKG